jgi:hypothetical protein
MTCGLTTWREYYAAELAKLELPPYIEPGTPSNYDRSRAVAEATRQIGLAWRLHQAAPPQDPGLRTQDPP